MRETRYQILTIPKKKAGKTGNLFLDFQTVEYSAIAYEPPMPNPSDFQ